ncbi:hypothetical protein HK097_008392, partial [Rhizophlyctis rosea]
MQNGQGRQRQGRGASAFPSKPGGKPRVTLEVQNQRKLVGLIQEYQSQLPPNSDKVWDEDAILDFVRRDHQMKRLPQAKVAKSLSEAIAFVKADTQNQEDDDSQASDSDDLEPDVPYMEVKDTNFLNRSLAGLYNKQNPPSSPRQSAPTSLTPSSFIAEPVPATKADDEPIARTATPDTAADDERRGSKRRQKVAGGGSDSKKAKTSLATLLAKYPTPTNRLSDLGGLGETLEEEVLQLIVMPLKHSEIHLHLGIQPPRGVLLHGPPGCGKTLLAHSIAGEAGVPFISISAPSVVSGMSGESEKKIREVFEEAKEAAPCLLFIDEIDAITPKRETAQREMERRIVAQLLTCMDDLSLDRTNGKPVLLIGATNRPDSLDPALRRAGRFDREISMGVPDEKARERFVLIVPNVEKVEKLSFVSSILKKLSSKLRLSGDFDFNKLAKLTPGYVGADLNALTAEAGMIAVRRILESLRTRQAQIKQIAEAEESAAQQVEETRQPDGDSMDVDDEDGISFSSTGPLTTTTEPLTTTPMPIREFLQTRTDPLSETELAPLCITHADFLAAIKVVQPSAKREGFATVPGVSWNDIGALSSVREELRMAVVEPVRRPEFFERVGITAPMGVLLYGPPGCGKTLLAKAVANESCCNFISVKGPELLNKYVGESERGVRMVFSRAAASSPCVIFFDELDALCPARSNDAESQSSSRLVNTLLTEMDGMSGRKQVYVIAATNRPDMIDPAMLRPGRLDKTLYVDLPNADERFEILKTLTRKTPLKGVDLRRVAESG